MYQKYLQNWRHVAPSALAQIKWLSEAKVARAREMLRRVCALEMCWWLIFGIHFIWLF